VGGTPGLFAALSRQFNLGDVLAGEFVADAPIFETPDQSVDKHGCG
jgi:hypothetical protein